MLFWTGWSAVIAFLQIWHLLLPVRGLALAAVGLAGLAGLALEARELGRLAGLALRRAPGPIALLAVVMVWAANRSTGPVQFYDIGLYYLQAVQWLNGHSIVPGLMNLQPQPGFPSAYFLFAALVNTGPLDGLALNIANGVPLVGLLASGLVGAAVLAAGRGPRRSALWHTLTIAPALAYLFGQEGGGPSLPAEIYLNGFAPDVAIFALGMALSGLMAPLLLEPGAHSPARRSHLRFAVALVACAGVAIKLSFAAYGPAAVAVVYGLALAEERPRTARAWAALVGPLAACVVAVSAVGVARLVILSGYPLYPASFGALPVPWRVPLAVAVEQDNVMKATQRQLGAHWSDVLGNNAWFQPWANYLHPLVTRPLGLTILAALVGLATLVGAPAPRRALARGGLFLLPPAASALLWFLVAPGYRFVGAAFWALGLGLVLLLAERLSARLPRQACRPVCLAAALLVLLYTAPVRNPLLMAPNPDSPRGVHPPPEASLTTAALGGGLVVNVPVGDPRCWAAPMPCTYSPDARLRLVRAGDLGSGFVYEPRPSDVELTPAPIPGVSAPDDLGVRLHAGWHDYEPEAGQRWVAEAGSLLLFSERPRTLRMTLVPAAMREGDGFGDEGRLLVTAAGRTYTADLVSGEPATLALPIGRHFTRVDLRLEAGSLIPAQTTGGGEDTRALSIAVSSLSFADE